MHKNQAFRGHSRTDILDFAVERGFGVFAVGQESAAPLATHAPFALLEDGAVAEAHIMRVNPIAQALKGGPLPAKLIISGADAYVSPDWYGLGPDHVPTWNYRAAHLTGALELAPEESLRAHLDRLSAQFEARLAPKRPWTVEKMTPQAYERMARGILPVRLRIETIEATFKLNQNKEEAGRLAAADHIEQSAIGSEAGRSLAPHMRRKLRP